jgi:hypothetical protein
MLEPIPIARPGPMAQEKPVLQIVRITFWFGGTHREG